MLYVCDSYIKLKVEKNLKPKPAAEAIIPESGFFCSNFFGAECTTTNPPTPLSSLPFLARSWHVVGLFDNLNAAHSGCPVALHYGMVIIDPPFTSYTWHAYCIRFAHS